MSNYSELDELKDELLMEKRRTSSYRNLVPSLEEQRGFYKAECDKLREAARTIASEREANEILTNENEYLREKLRELQSREMGGGPGVH